MLLLLLLLLLILLLSSLLVISLLLLMAMFGLFTGNMLQGLIDNVVVVVDIDDEC